MKKKSIGKVLFLELAVVLVVCSFNLMTFRSSYRLAYFIDIPTLFSLLLFTVPALFVTGMAKDFARAFSIGKKPCSLCLMKRSLEAVKMVQRLLLCGMLLSAVIALEVLLYQMSELAVVGPYIAVVMLAVFYGIILEFLLIPVSAHVQNCITDTMDLPESEEVPEETISAEKAVLSANAKCVRGDDDEED